jgi:hypothetical protein
MNLLKEGKVTGVNFSGLCNEACILHIQGKQTRAPFKKMKARRATGKLEIIH